MGQALGPVRDYFFTLVTVLHENTTSKLAENRGRKGPGGRLQTRTQRDLLKGPMDDGSSDKKKVGNCSKPERSLGCNHPNANSKAAEKVTARKKPPS